MKNIKILGSFLIIVFCIVFFASFNLKASAESTSKVIVVLDSNVSIDNAVDFSTEYDLDGVKKLEGINGLSFTIPDRNLKALANDPIVKYVVNDDIVTALKPTETIQAETLPWGIDTVEADQVWSAHTGAGINVAVLDTGIDMDHPDLAANIKGGINLVNTRKTFDDDNGHGTHVSGTIAAVNNDFGVIGVAPEANLYGVKVLNQRGSGYTSDVIEGIEWAVNNNMDIISMSLSSAYYNAAFEVAINYAYNNGVIVVAAAGNESTSVSYPAAYDNVIGVSAMDQNYDLAYFSNYGPQIDVTAPGVSITSTYYKGQYAIMSGTSMATPHVTGVIALMLESGTANTYEDVIARFKTGCVDLGITGKDIYFGYGLVDASTLTN